MGRLVLTGADVVLGAAGAPAVGATVVVEGKRIAAVLPAGAAVDARPDDRTVDLGGRTVMPGMATCHFHSTYHELGSKPAPFGLEEPLPLQVVRAVNNLAGALRAGFTTAVSAGAPHAIDASMKQAIAEGAIEGPRLVPGSRDLSTTGHANDLSFPSHWDVRARGAIHRCDGPAEFQRAVREEVKEGAEVIKLFVTGGHGTTGPRERMEISPDELAAAIETAHERGVLIRGHIANREALLLAVSLGIDIVDHGDGLDAECIEAMAEAGTFLVPSQFFPFAFHEAMSGAGLGFTDTMKQEVDEATAVLAAAQEGGVRMLLGDDYGALGFPHGRYAEELGFYVREAGIAPLDVLGWATANAAALVGRSHELGSVEEGRLADLLVVDGDPTTDVDVLRDPDNLLAVLVGGRPAKDELDRITTPDLAGV